MEAMLNRIADYLQAQSWQIGVLVAAVALISWALRHRSAHVRYLLWLVVLAKCIVPPVVNVPLPVLPDRTPQAAVLTISPPSGERPLTRTPAEMRPMPIVRSAPQTRLHLGTRQWLAIAWLAGVGVFAFVATIKAGRTALWLRRQRQMIPPDLQTNVGDLLSSLGLRRLPRMWLIEGVGQPFVWGLVRGDIYLPRSFVGVTSDEHRRGILGHELSHVLRFDAAVNILQIIAQAIFWFHPLVWWANKRIRAEREKSCDEMAIARLGTQAKEYSTAIVNTLIQEQESTRPVPSLAIAGPAKNIEERIRTMLRPGKKFYRRPSLAVGVVVGLIALLAVPTALILTARAQTPTTAETTDRLGKTLHQAAADGDLEEIKRLLAKGLDIDTRDEKDMTPLHFAAKEGHKAVVEFLIAKGASINVVEKNGAKPVWLAMANDHRDIVDLLIRKGAKVLPMNLAACFGDTDRVRELIQEGADVNAKETGDSKGRQALHWAVAHGHKDTAELLIKNGANTSGRANTMWTPLHVAAQNGQREMVELLLALGAEVTAKARWDYTPLHVALWGKSPDVIEMLLDAGADMYAEDEWGERPVDQVAQGNAVELVTLFIAKGMDPNRPSTKSGWTAVHEATCRGSKEVMQLLLSEDVDVNRKEKNGLTPIQLAMEQSGSVRTEVVRLLVTHGAEIPPIHAAAYLGDIEKVRALLIKSDMDINAQWLDIGTPLCAAAAGNQTDMVKWLLTQGADINAGDDTPLHKAAWNDCKEVVHLLVDKGADIHAKNSDGYTPIHYAALAEPAHEDMLDLLLSKGANINAKENRGMTLLHYMAWGNKVNLIEFLLARGADIEAKSMWDTTPLSFAVLNGKLGATQLLLSKGAAVNVTYEDSKTLLSVAKEKGHTEIVELLRKHGAKEEAPPAPDNLEPAKSLHQAVSDGALEQVRRLITGGADVNAKSGRWDWTPLHIAARYGHTDICGLLILNKAQVDAKARPGQTPLLYAARYGHKDVAELLVDKGADINARSDLEGTPLYGAAAGGHEALAKWLVSKGADPNAALFCAARFGHPGATTLLLAKGASVEAKDENGLTPLHQAASYCHTNVAELLINQGADVNAKDNDGATPAYAAAGTAMLFNQQQVRDMVGLLLARGAEVDIHLAAFSGDLERVKSFLEGDINVDAKAAVQFGWQNNILTPLCMAAISGQKEVVRFLIDQGADVNARVGMAQPELSSGPLSFALIYPDYEVAKLLIDNGADVNAGGVLGSPLSTMLWAAEIRGEDVFQETSLDIGFSSKEFELAMEKQEARGAEYAREIWPELQDVVELLLARGAEVDAKGLGGMTPLSYAAVAGLKDAAALFIAHGADVNAKDDKGNTPLALAREAGHTEIVELLRKHGAKE